MYTLFYIHSYTPLLYLYMYIGKHAVAVNPNEGTMAGVCITLQKDTGKFSLFGGGSKGVKVVPLWYVCVRECI